MSIIDNLIDDKPVEFPRSSSQEWPTGRLSAPNASRFQMMRGSEVTDGEEI